MSIDAPFSYVLPLRWKAGEEAREEITEYLRQVAGWCNDVIVVDGSPPEVFAANAALWGDRYRHIAPNPVHQCLMGKVAGVLSGIDAARHDRVVLADDDVRYDRTSITRVVTLLGEHDLVRPQNFFSPMPWHASWDTARTLLNRATGADFPGTLGVRRDTVLEMGGYDGDVMFENLELIRTVAAHGGSVISPLDLFVARRPPSSAHFWSQRTRQAYDDFAIPARMAIWLSIIPGMTAAVIRRRMQLVLLAVSSGVLLAERGRRRSGGAAVFPVVSSALAPVWVLERALCAWLAVIQRLRFGGVRYGDAIIRVAANSPRRLRRNAAVSHRLVASGSSERP